MKIRQDFVTNSSSVSYLITNITDEVKTMWNLLEEAAEGPWEFEGWPHYEEEEEEEISDEEYDEYFDYDMKRIPKDPVLLQKFMEDVAELQIFPPGESIKISIALGDGGPIYCPDGLRDKAESFKIEWLGPD